MVQKTVVEGMLPARHLVELGVYVQTCAHIENACWSLFRLLDPKARDQSNAAFVETIKVKLGTTTLLKRFESVAKYAHPSEAIRIKSVHRRMVEGLENRNMAAHGAFFYSRDTDTLNVEHYFKRKSDPKGVYRLTTDPISQVEINEAIEDADLILRELIDLKSCVSRRLTPSPEGTGTS